MLRFIGRFCRDTNVCSNNSIRVTTMMSTRSAKEVKLSPMDVSFRLRPIPMLWYYKQTLNLDKLRDSLRDTLTHFPVLTGTYTNNATAVSLVKADVTIEEAFSDAVIDTVIEQLLPVDKDSTTVSFYSQDYQEIFMPSIKSKMDPDAGTPEVPLFAVKVTSMSPGTVIAVLIQHGVMDAESVLIFMKNWSRVFRGESVEILENYRSFGLDISTEEEPINDRWKVIQANEVKPPPFAALMPKIMGTKACIVSLSKSTLNKMIERASKEIEKPLFISTDDMLTARVWKAFVTIRCAQLDIPADSDKMTSVFRAINLRTRLEPNLNPNTIANAIYPVCSELTVKQVVTLSVAQIALELRSTLNDWTPGKISATLQCMKSVQIIGARVGPSFGPDALDFVISSWNFPNSGWEEVDFSTRPLFYEHRFHGPFICVYTSRPGMDGINVWTSGQPDALETFARVINSN